MKEMTGPEWRAFLLSSPGDGAPARTGKAATVRPDGRPHVAAVWFDLDDDGALVFTTHKTSVKGRCLRADPRLAVCVDSEVPPFAHVVLEGTVTISEEPEDLLAWATRIGGRYMGQDRAEAYGRRNGVPGELLIRLAPTKVIARTGISD